jgi:hypothetical protein
VRESDYAGKDVKGKIVLAAAQPGEVQDLAVGKFGALGIVSNAQNQKTAWLEENGKLVRWGHLQSCGRVTCRRSRRSGWWSRWRCRYRLWQKFKTAQ